MGILRQGPTLPSPNLRYRLRTIENLPRSRRPTVTLVIACSDQANRRAARTLGHPTEHRTFFVATEGEQLAGDHRAVVWQQCGNGMGAQVKIAPSVSLDDIIVWTGQLLESDEADRRRLGFLKPSKTIPDPDALYPRHLLATMSDLHEQVKSCLAVQLTCTDKEVLDLLAAWPLCNTEQLMGLKGGVTRRHANQVIQSLTGRSLVRTREQRHVLTDEGLRYLAHREMARTGVAVPLWVSHRERMEVAGPLGQAWHSPEVLEPAGAFR